MVKEMEIINGTNSQDQINLLSKIIKALTINGNFVDSLGLGDGKMGIALLFFNYYRNFQKTDYEKYANNLLEDIYEQITIKTSLDFTSGLTGIGWGIEYLAKSNFIEGDTDEILDEIDKAVNSKLITQGDVSSFKLSDQSGYDFYLNARKHDVKLALKDLRSFFRLPGTGLDIFSVKFLVESGNYGLFSGLAGIGLLTLLNLSSRI